jgi:hypothetical protein
VKLESQLNALKQEYQMLDGRLRTLMRSPVCDALQINELKKTRENLKKQIAKLSGMITPDIIA